MEKSKSQGSKSNTQGPKTRMSGGVEPFALLPRASSIIPGGKPGGSLPYSSYSSAQQQAEAASDPFNQQLLEASPVAMLLKQDPARANVRFKIYLNCTLIYTNKLVIAIRTLERRSRTEITCNLILGGRKTAINLRSRSSKRT
jgi:hypothetical protein